MIVKYSPDFLITLKKTDVRIRKSFKLRIAIFSKNSIDPLLDNHSLKKQWQGYRSIDITTDWRAIYKELHANGEIIAYFVAIGTHKDLYK